MGTTSVLLVWITVLGKNSERLQCDDGSRSHIYKQRIHCCGHQDLTALKRRAELVVDPGDRCHGRLCGTRMVHFLLLATVRAVGRR
jgi:hypothetical protein